MCIIVIKFKKIVLSACSFTHDQSPKTVSFGLVIFANFIFVGMSCYFVIAVQYGYIVDFA